MKKLVTGFLAFLISLAVLAEEKKNEKASVSADDVSVAIAGTVFDSFSGELLVGVEVLLEDTGSKTYTDFDGQFSFNGVQPGEYTLITNYISYKKCSETLIMDPGKNEVVIKLETSD